MSLFFLGSELPTQEGPGIVAIGFRDRGDVPDFVFSIQRGSRETRLNPSSDARR